MQTVSEAGGVVFRRTDGGLQFLVVTAKADPTQWIFPKGHVERNEAARDAAVREVSEEAGVVGRVVTPLEVVTFPGPNETLQVEYFLLEYSRNVAPVDHRDHRWLSFDEALATLTFEEARSLLRSARTWLDAAAGPSPSRHGRTDRGG